MSAHTTSPAGPSTTGLPAAPHLGAKSRPAESVIKAVLFGSAMLSIAFTFGIIAVLIRSVIDFFGELPLGDFYSIDGRYVVLPQYVGPLM